MTPVPPYSTLSLLRPARLSVVVLLLLLLGTRRSPAQPPVCGCIDAWQRHTAPPAGCPQRDTAGRYDRTARSYLLFTGSEAEAQAAASALLDGIRTCPLTAPAFRSRTDYDPVQMTDIHTFLPTGKPMGGQPALVPVKMELSVRSRASSSAVLLKINETAPIPGGGAAFVAATGRFLDEWGAALARRIPFTGPDGGWAALYPAARYAGAGPTEPRQVPGTAHWYEWTAADGEGLQQSLMQALRKTGAVAAGSSWYDRTVPGRSSVIGCRLLPPNPPAVIETVYDGVEGAGTVRLSIIVPESPAGAR